MSSEPINLIDFNWNKSSIPVAKPNLKKELKPEHSIIWIINSYSFNEFMFRNIYGFKHKLQNQRIRN